MIAVNGKFIECKFSLELFNLRKLEKGIVRLLFETQEEGIERMT